MGYEEPFWKMYNKVVKLLGTEVKWGKKGKVKGKGKGKREGNRGKGKVMNENRKK